MRNLILGFALCLVTLVTAALYADTLNRPTSEAMNQRRPCAPDGAAVAVDCSNAASAASAVLTTNTRHEVMCGDDSYVDWLEGSAPTAASGDMILPQYSWYEFISMGQTYFACRNVNVDSACWYHKCL